MWDLPGRGLKPLSPALAGGFLTSEPPGKPPTFTFIRAMVQVGQNQFSSVAQSCPTHCHPMDCSMPGLPVHHQLPEYTQTLVSIKLVMPSCGAVSAGRRPRPGFRFPLKWWDSLPHQVTWSQPINMRLARKREPIRGKLKSPRTPKFEKSPRRFGPIRLLCKHVTNPLKPATNCLCTPYKLGNSLGSALSEPVPLRWTCGGSPDLSQQ